MIAPGPRDVRFENGNHAVLVTGGSDPRALPEALGLEGARPVILVCGGAGELTGAALERAEAVLGPAVMSAAALAGATVLDGGTATGVMAAIGKARADHGEVPLVGVAPAGRVAVAPQRDRVELEPHHTHFVLADGDEWGDETELLIGLAETLAGKAPVVTVLGGGGAIAQAEALAAVRRGWPVFVVEGTGGAADAIAEKRPAVREIVERGDVRRFAGEAPAELARRLAWELQDEPVLEEAWRTFATYDRLATRMRRSFERVQGTILALGVLGTFLALLHDALGGAALHWGVVAAPIAASVLIALAARRAAGKAWVLLRGAAEATKAEIFHYRTRTGVYADRQLPGGDPARRGGVLAAQLETIADQLVQTPASGGPLTPYDGPLPPPMYGAAAEDDGLSRLDATRYLRVRIEDQLAYYHGRIRRLDRRRNVFQLLAIGAGGSGAIVAAAGQEIWIGLTTAIAAAALSYLAYLQVDATVIAYNQSASRLQTLKRGWAARSESERDAAAFEELVVRGEAVLTTELGGWVQQMNEALRELQARQADAAREAVNDPERRSS